jgi:hypothetical protein
MSADHRDNGAAATRGGDVDEPPQKILGRLGVSLGELGAR